MTTKETILGIAIGVVLIGGVVWYVLPSSPKRKPVARGAAVPAAPAPKPAASTNAPAGTNTLAAGLPEPVDRKSLDSRWLSWVRAPIRDPFLLLPPPPRKEAAPLTPASRLQLSGLWVQTGGRLAVINQAVYGEGDTVMGFKILRIDSKQVLVQGPEKTEPINFTTYVPGATNAVRRTNMVEVFLGPEKENLRY